jgi:hypothetical protein
VEDIQRRTVLSNGEAWNQGDHSVCAPCTVG